MIATTRVFAEERETDFVTIHAPSDDLTIDGADDAARWQAVLDRDEAADGTFVYAVQTTGIYCRPSCPSRRPRRDRVTFFALPEAAEHAGFRACKRCHPEQTAI